MARDFPSLVTMSKNCNTDFNYKFFLNLEGWLERQSKNENLKMEHISSDYMKKQSSRT